MEYYAVFIIAVSFFMGVFLLTKPIMAVWAILIWSMVVSGTVIYFFPVAARIQWGNAFLALMLFLRVFLDILFGRSGARRFPLYFFLMVVFVFLAVIASLVDLEIKQFLVSAKNYFQFWSLPLALFFIVRKEDDVEKYMKFFVVLAMLMPPLAAVQFFFFGGPTFPGDAVTGTFGGKMYSGGPNALFSVFIVLQMAVLLLFAQRRCISMIVAIGCSAWLFSILFLTNAKAVFIFIPIMIGFIYYRDVIRSPQKVFAAVILVSIILGAMFQFYFSQSFKYNRQQIGAKNYSEFLGKTFKGNFGTEDSNRLNRMTVYTFWWNETTSRRGLLPILIGHGLGAAKWAGIEQGHIQGLPRYRDTKLAPTALVRLLWDVGIMGTLIYMLIFVKAFFDAGRMLKNSNLPPVHQVFMKGARLACMFYLFSLPYQLSIINIQAVNFHAMFNLAFIAFWHARLQKSVAHVQKNAIETLAMQS